MSRLPNPELGCIAAIVGYREYPIISTKALESYLDAKGCQFVLTCIDGNEPNDRLTYFERYGARPISSTVPSSCALSNNGQVHPSRSTFLNLPVPLVDIALQMDRVIDTMGQDATIIEKFIALIKQTLLERQIHLTGPDSITHLCVTQPQMHKKGIMLT